MDDTKLQELLQLKVPNKYQLSELAYTAYVLGHRFGARRARVLRDRQVDIGIEIPAELCGRKLAGGAWMHGQCDGYEREVRLHEEIDKPGQADWEDAKDAPEPMCQPSPVRAIRGAGIALSLLILVLGALMLLSGCTRKKKPAVAACHCQREQKPAIEIEASEVPAESVELPAPQDATCANGRCSVSRWKK